MHLSYVYGFVSSPTALILRYSTINGTDSSPLHLTTELLIHSPYQWHNVEPPGTAMATA